MKQLWRSLWQDRQDPVHDVTVYRGSDPIDTVDVPATMKVLRLPKILSSLGDVLIRNDYKEALEDLGKINDLQKNSVIIVGHPGIGSAMVSVRQADYSYMRPHV